MSSIYEDLISMILSYIPTISLPAYWHQTISKIQEMPIPDLDLGSEIEQSAHLNII